jgi:hypothetical protein
LLNLGLLTEVLTEARCIAFSRTGWVVLQPWRLCLAAVQTHVDTALQHP